MFENRINEVVEYAKECFKDNLVNLTLGGSCGKGNQIEGWSDIDLYVALKEFNYEQIEKFFIIDRDDIHVGITLYTLNEIKNNMLDFKTQIMLYEKQNYNVNRTLYGEDIYPHVSYETVKINDYKNLPPVLHECRRNIIQLESNKVKLNKKMIKKLFVLLKCYLDCNNIFSYGYNEVLTKFSNYCFDNNIEFDNSYKDDIMYIIHNILVKDIDSEYINKYIAFNKKVISLAEKVGGNYGKEN